MANSRQLIWSRVSVTPPAMVLIPLGCFVFLAAYRGDAKVLLLAIVAGFILAAFARPVWAVGALLFLEFTQPNNLLDVAQTGISARFLLTLIALTLASRLVLRRDALGPRGFLMLSLFGALTGVMLVSNLLHTNQDTTFRNLRYIFTMLTKAALIPAVTNSRKDLVRLCVVVLTAATLSAMVAIMQHYHIRGLHGFDIRAIGLGDGDVGLSSQVSVALLLLLGVLLVTRVSSPTVAAFLMAGSGILLLAMYFTYTRDGPVSLALGALVFMVLLKGKVRFIVVAAVLLVLIAFFVVISARPSRYSLVDPAKDDSLAGRPILWLISYNIAMDNFLLGIGDDRFKEESLEYRRVIDPESLVNEKTLRGLGRYSPHNDFLTLWLSFGIFALLIYLLIVATSFINFLAIYRYGKDQLLVGLALGGAAAFAGYHVFAFTQNPFFSYTIIAIFAGLSAALLKLHVASAPEPLSKADMT